MLQPYQSAPRNLSVDTHGKCNANARSKLVGCMYHGCAGVCEVLCFVPASYGATRDGKGGKFWKMMRASCLPTLQVPRTWDRHPQRPECMLLPEHQCVECCCVCFGIQCVVVQLNAQHNPICVAQHLYCVPSLWQARVVPYIVYTG